jgi:allantoate deiminase
MARCERLATLSEEEGRVTRTFLSGPMLQVHEVVKGWMEEAGMAVRVDEVGNLIGRYVGSSESAPCLILGSHLDTVRDAGKYDGVLGVLLGIAVVKSLEGERLPFALEVIGFADEEGVRYGTPFLGSLAYSGQFPPALLELRDASGISLREAIDAFSGGSERIIQKRFDPANILGYIEVHIEQGPVLESLDKAVAPVDAIAGSSRASVTFRGKAGHAGTVPMTLRQDALAGAAAFVLEVEHYARAVPGLMATVGNLRVMPGAVNVIPGEVVLSLDVRHAYDAVRERAVGELRARAQDLALERRLELSWQALHDQEATPLDPRLTGLLSKALGSNSPRLTSGAGHDAMIMAKRVPAAMLLVRSPGGVSHHPDEMVLEEDVAEALRVMSRFLEKLASKP